MSYRGASAWTLAGALLLSGSLGLVDHEHLVWSQANAAVCTVDHVDGASVTPRQATARGARVDRAAAGHEHDCVACHLARTRCTAGARGATGLHPGLAAERVVAEVGAAPEPGGSWSRSARGPPRS